MELKIAWRNPLPLIRAKRTLQRIRKIRREFEV